MGAALSLLAEASAVDVPLPIAPTNETTLRFTWTKEEVDACIAAAKAGNLDVVAAAVEKHGPHIRDELWNAPLAWAAEEGHADIVQFLLRRGADVDLKNENGNTPLICSAWKGRTTVTRLLLEAGADPDAVNGNKNTALIWAAAKGHAQDAALLLCYGADIAHTGKDRQSALHRACEKEHTHVVTLLRNHGADRLRKSRDDDGYTPEDLASNPKGQAHVAMVAPLQPLSLFQRCFSYVLAHRTELGPSCGLVMSTVTSLKYLDDCARARTTI
ncbi:Hypothetical protein UVM_LOCUS60 [uncultured virus]|nr:Hypothetical protein UVM_LOCUS60 [uncultured virus]